MEKKPVVYLSGGIENSKNMGISWRFDVGGTLQDLGYEVIDPVVSNKPNATLALRDSNFPQFKKVMSNTVNLDIRYVMDSDLIVCKIDESAITGSGTHGELTIAKHFGVPIYAWVDIHTGLKRLPAWMLGCLVDDEGNVNYYRSKKELIESLR